MKNMYNLFKRFITIATTEGGKAAFKAFFNLLTAEYYIHKYLLLRRYYKMFHVDLVRRKIHGNKMCLYVNDTGLSRELLLRGTREEVQTRLMKQLVRPGMVVADIGANIGYYVLIEATIVGETGKVYAMEPVPQNYELLCKNMRENNYDNIVETYSCAISDVCGTRKIAVTKQSNLATILTSEDEMSEYAKKALKLGTERTLDVETITLDKFLEDKGQVDFIRMDVEGHEVEIVRGMLDTLKNSRIGTRLFIEIHPNLFDKPRAKMEEIMQNLIRSGFEMKYLADQKSTKLLDFTPDNLLDIVVSEGSAGIFLEKTHHAV
ncbi:FkbM family methyltransferase [Chloroflexota bacterium]